MKRIIRTRRLTVEEVTWYRAIRVQVEKELPDLIACHHARRALQDQLKEILPDSRIEKDPGYRRFAEASWGRDAS